MPSRAGPLFERFMTFQVFGAMDSREAKQHTTGNGAIPDYSNPEQMNRYTWYQTHGWKVPYPGDAKVYGPSQVPVASLPGADTD